MTNDTELPFDDHTAAADQPRERWAIPTHPDAEMDEAIELLVAHIKDDARHRKGNPSALPEMYDDLIAGVAAMLEIIERDAIERSDTHFQRFNRLSRASDTLMHIIQFPDSTCR